MDAAFLVHVPSALLPLQFHDDECKASSVDQ